MPRRLIAAVAALVVSTLAPRGESTDRSGDEAFLQWAAHAKIVLPAVAPTMRAADLAPLKSLIGDAQVVALSEPTHLAAEPLELRNRLLELLVRDLGFTAVALESGLTESRPVYDFVLGGPGDLDSVVRQGFSWTFDQLPQNAELVKWLRAYNAPQVESQRVRFYGIDVPGSPGNPSATRGIRTGLEAALGFLKRVAPEEGRQFEARLSPFWKNLGFDLRPESASLQQYWDLAPGDRDHLTAILADLVSLFERNEVVYAGRTMADECQWAYRSAVGARAVDYWLRQLPSGWKPTPGRPWWDAEWVDLAREVRDRAMAENLEWVLARERERGPVLIFAHRLHVAADAVQAYSKPPAPSWSATSVLGYYLRHRLGRRLLTIGALVGGGTAGCGEDRWAIGPSPVPSLDDIVGRLQAPLLLLDLRGAPPNIRSWLDEERLLWDGDMILSLHPGVAYDALLYFAKVSPACPEKGLSR